MWPRVSALTELCDVCVAAFYLLYCAPGAFWDGEASQTNSAN